MKDMPALLAAALSMSDPDLFVPVFRRVIVIVSDNESWVDPARHGATATMNEWTRLKGRNPAAKLICIDIQAYGTTQAKGRKDIMNVGGFTDAVFDAMARFASGETRDWVSIINETEV